MKKYLVLILMLLSMATTAFAATLEDDTAEVAAEQVANTVQRSVYMMDRLSGTLEEFTIVNDSDYLPVITEMNQGDLVATCDDQVKLNLQVQVKRYSDRAVTRKMVLVPISFKHLTVGEQQKHADLEEYSIYSVEEQPVQGKAGPIVIDNQAGFENISYLVNMLVQLKMVN